MFKAINSEINNPEINLDFIEQIQASGGVHFRDERYITTGNGYEVCIHVFSYPNKISDFWLTYITGISDAVVTIDVSNKSFDVIQENLNKNIKEQAQRVVETKKPNLQLKAIHERDKNVALLDQLLKMDDAMKIIVSRIYVSEKTRDKVDEAATNIINKLSSYGFKSAILLNENAFEWKSMYYSYKEQCKQSGLYRRIGQPVLATTLSRGNPFHYASLSDDLGSYWGDTDVGGAVIFDPFLKNKERKHYNIVMIGTMGSGKSTTFKKIMEDQSCRGNYIRGFDITGECNELVKQLGGKIVSLDGKDGIINILEIFQSSLDDSDGEGIESQNWQNHVSKLSIMYEYLVPNVDEYEKAYFKLILKDFYRAIHIYPQDESELQKKTGVITGLAPDEYPILSDLAAFLKKMLDKGMVDPDRIEYHNHILLIIDTLVQNFGNIFNGHTSIKDILSEKVISFNLTSVLKLEANILDTILYNIFSLCWDNLIRVGGKMKDLYDKKEIEWEDITRFMILIDEAHKIINSNKIRTVEQILSFSREARKYFGGIALASQSIRDFVPEGTSQYGFDTIKTLFELSQYKFIMQQDNNVIPLLKKIFDGELTDTMIKQVPKLTVGETILVLSSKHSIKFRIRITEKERMLFAGGA